MNIAMIIYKVSALCSVTAGIMVLMAPRRANLIIGVYLILIGLLQIIRW